MTDHTGGHRGTRPEFAEIRDTGQGVGDGLSLPTHGADALDGFDGVEPFPPDRPVLRIPDGAGRFTGRWVTRPQPRRRRCRGRQ